MYNAAHVLDLPMKEPLLSYGELVEAMTRLASLRERIRLTSELIAKSKERLAETPRLVEIASRIEQMARANSPGDLERQAPHGLK